MISEHKFNRYLLYAFGEIILVVIGILIALYINNLNEQNKTKAKVELIFEEMMEELATNISEVKRAGIFFKRKDSLTNLVLNTDISREHYTKDAYAFLSITGISTSIKLTDNAYNKLMQVSEAVPEQYNELMDDLHKLNDRKVYIDHMNTRFN